ncbi:MAG: D-alanine--D-alanine ligase [Pseudomonadota bacterium]
MGQNIAILAGGISAEREVSLVSANAVAEALQGLGIAHVVIDPRPDLHELVTQLTPRPDVIFNALHGSPGEDGVFQAIFDYMKIPYTHSGMQASANAMDKAISRKLFAHAGLPIAKGMVCAPQDTHNKDLLPRPYVLKPSSQGSSVGTYIFREDGNTKPDMHAWDYGTVLLEEFIPGAELTVSVLDGKAVGVTELRPASGFYDYTSKYTAHMTEHIFPAKIPQSLSDTLCTMAEQAHQILGCRSVTRADFRVDHLHDATPHIVLLEINTQPGMTPLSLVPEQTQGIGMDFPKLVQWIIQRACHD